MRTRTSRTALLIALGVSIAACSGGDGVAETTTTPPTTTTTAPPSTTTTTSTTIGVSPLVVWAAPEAAAALDGYDADFRAETGIPVEIVGMEAAGIAPAVLADPAGGPDVFMIGHRSLPALVDAGLVAELAVSDTHAYQTLAIEAFTSDGSLYALPFALESRALYRNADLVPDAPMSYADLRADCEDLSPGIRCIGIPSDDTASHLAVLHAFGGYAFAYGDGGFDTTDIGLAGEGALAAAAFLDAEAAAGRLDPALTTAAAAEEFADGDLAFFFSTPLGDPGIDDWDAQALRPDGAGGRAAVLADAYGLAVSAATDRPEAAEWFVLEFMTDRQVAFELFLAGGRPPALAQAYTDAVATDPRIAAFNPASADPAVLYPALPETRTLLGAFANAVGIVYHQAYDEAVPDAATAFTQAATAVRSMLDGG